MAGHDNAWAARERHRWMRPNAHLWIRPDAYRFMPAGAPRYVGKDAVRYFWPEADRARLSQVETCEDAEALRTERDYLLRLRSELLPIKADLKLRRLLRALKAYNPNQPRVPAGNPDGGQWTRDGTISGERRIRLAGEIPTNEPPDLPKERPATIQERNRIARGVSRSLRLHGLFGISGQALEWLKEYWPEIVADQDPPKTLPELQDAALSPKKGYHIHHIVEQGPARDEGFSEEIIESRENRVLIPKYQHERISAWFSTNAAEFDGMSPREYLRGKAWDERARVGRQSLYIFGVLKP